MIVNYLLNWLNNNPYLNLLFILLGIGGVFVSIFLYFKARKLKEPRYLTKSFAVIDDNISTIDELEIKYKQQDIQRLTISKISFWNKGRETIDGSDIAPADKLHLLLEGDGKIISAKQIFEKRKATNINISPQDNKIYLNFDFLDLEDGAIFEIYHTGSAKTKLKMKGSIKGVNKIKYGEYQKDYLLDKVGQFFFGWFDKINLKKGSLIETILIVTLIPFLVPFVIILAPIDKIGTYLHKIPKEYDLSNEKTFNNT